LKFDKLADIFEKIEATTKRLEITDLLANLLKETPREVVDQVIYLSQGKLYPDYIGIELGIADKLVIKAIALASGKNEETVLSIYKNSGDLGEVAEEILRKKAQMALIKAPLTVETVYRSFEKIAEVIGPGSVDMKVKLLSSLLNDATPKEAKYVVRMALGKLRLGIADMTILDALAVAYGGDKETRPLLERAYNLCSDLGYVAKTVASKGIQAISRFKIALGRPIRPMLCERLSSAQEILDKLGGVAAAEYKYDGLRIQAHISKQGVQLFSRRLENITNQFPDVSRLLQASTHAEEAVLEGECVAVDPNTGDMLPFQVISQRRGRKYEIKEKAEEIPVSVFLFDILYLDGEDLTLKAYPERREILIRTIESSDHVHVAEQVVTKNVEDLERYFDQAVSVGCEGLVLKNISQDSIYQAGARGWLWIKYKRSYKAEVADTFDLVPIGAFYGKGKRAGTYGALLMATYNPDKDIFETVCKLGSGFSDEDLKDLPLMMKESLIPHRHFRVTSTMEADVWFTPSNVAEVAADEITLSPLHTCGLNLIRKGSGFALRFPRFTGNWRRDKSPEDATTTHEVLEMYQRQLKKIET
jgi:DNA ligase-1